jgi:predicted ATPase
VPAGVPDASRCEFAILGPLAIRCGGLSLPLPAPRSRAVLAVLLVHANRVVSVDELCDELWQERPPASARSALHVHIAALRRALGSSGALLQTRAPGYVFELDDDQLDARRFEGQLRAATAALADQRPGADGRLRDALALWRGPALAEFADLPCVRAESTRLEELRLAALEQRIEVDLDLGRHPELAAELQQLTAQHPYRERLHAQLMLALYRAGRQADALEAYRRAREMLVEQLGIEPADELRELHQAIRHDPGLAGPRAARRRSIDRASALPAPPNTLFGREADVEGLIGIVRQPRTRLVTLTGSGGVGKTRLAIETARRLAADFTDGGHLVELAVVAEPRDLASAIARGLAAPAREGEPANSALLRFLADRHVLLVLDNFEHLVEGAPLLGELLRACPELTILVTSRQPTRLAAERLYPVRPLEVPDPTTSATATELERYAAVAMFCDRALARAPDFALDDASAPHVSDICRRLDGLPLALELAAARIGLLSAAELAERLDDALGVLVGGARDAPERQRTLRATIDWSHNLLTDPERQAFARLAVFAGGATVASAEEVTGASLVTLDSLVAKELLERRGQRLVMLETVREYALERLAEHPDADAVRECLARWCLRFTHEATPHLVRADRVPWLARLEAELPNALAALSWALDTRHDEPALQLVAALGDYWWRSNRSDDGIPWIDAALQQASGASINVRATALLSRARLTDWRRQAQRHRDDLDAGLELFRSCDDAAGIATCLGHLSLAALNTGDYPQATELAGQAMRFAERSRNQAAFAFALGVLVVTATDYREVSARARSALVYLDEVGDLRQTVVTSNNAAYRAIDQHRYQEALSWLEGGLRAARELDDPFVLFLSWGNEGLARLFLGQLDHADRAFSDALAICRDAAAEGRVDETLMGLAVVAALRGELSHAARLAGAARAHQTGHMLEEDAVWSRLEELLEPARNRVGPEAWDRVEREGAALTAHEAIDLALARGRFAQDSSSEESPARYTDVGPEFESKPMSNMRQTSPAGTPGSAPFG